MSNQGINITTLPDSTVMTLWESRSGFSVEVNRVQVYWSKDKEKAEKFFDIYSRIWKEDGYLESLIAGLIS